MHAQFKSDELLYVAVQRNDLALARRAARRGADLAARTALGDTALHVIAALGRSPFLNLMEYAEPHTLDTLDARHCGETPLHVAVRAGHAETVAALLKAGADVHARLPNGDTALHAAARTGNDAMLRVLLQLSADAAAYAPSFDGIDAGVYASRYDRIREETDARTAHAVVSALAASKNGATALHLAARFGHAEACGVLLTAGASADAVTTYGVTPLMLAAERGHLMACHRLLHYRADAARKDSMGTTAGARARTAGYVAVAMLLAGAHPALAAETSSGNRFDNSR